MDPTLTREEVARAATGAPEAWEAEWEEAWEEAWEAAAAAVDSEVKCTSYALFKQLQGSNLNVL